MFYLLSKILFFLLSPYIWIVVVLVISILSRHPRVKKRLRTLAILLIVVFSNAFLSNMVVKQLEFPSTTIDQHFGIGIVLGGMVESGINIQDQTHLTESADRLVEAIKLYQEGWVKKILISGGAADINYPNENEGTKLFDLAVTLGVSKEDLILENRSRNTFENAKYVKELIPDDSTSILLITSAFHMRRAMACFQKQKLTFTPYAVDFRATSEVIWTDFLPSSKALEDWSLVIKELVGLFAYRLVGYA